MKTLVLALAATALTATGSLAATNLTDLDRNSDGFASVAEVEATFPGFSGSDFRAIDTNRDQRISAVELQNPGVRATIARYEATGDAVKALASIDTNADGFATHSELAVAYPGLTQSDFNFIDTNDDRRVSSNELFTPEAQVNLSRHDANEALLDIAALDTNGDNFAQYGELTAAYPGLVATDFNAIDLNDDRRISSNELYSLDAQTVLNRSGS